MGESRGIKVDPPEFLHVILPRHADSQPAEGRDVAAHFHAILELELIVTLRRRKTEGRTHKTSSYYYLR
jgi:hypothetical protein